MSIHLHELIALGADGEPLDSTSMDWMRQSVAFDMGILSEIDDSLSVIHDLVRLPYPVCWFEASGDPREWQSVFRYGVLATSLADQSILLECYIRAPDRFATHKRWLMEGSYSYKGGAIETFLPAKEVPIDDCTPVRMVLKFLSALNCTNVRRVEHIPPPKLQKARTKRGKVPLFSYWTLELDLGVSSTQSAPLGGTHASPRVHLRRGHPRQYAPGQWTWVQPHAVGNKSLGMVHKDYAVNPDVKWGQQCSQ